MKTSTGQLKKLYKQLNVWRKMLRLSDQRRVAIQNMSFSKNHTPDNEDDLHFNTEYEFEKYRAMMLRHEHMINGDLQHHIAETKKTIKNLDRVLSKRLKVTPDKDKLLEILENFPYLDSKLRPTDDPVYIPLLYFYDSAWHVDWSNDVSHSILHFSDEEMYRAIEKAYNWLKDNKKI